MVAGPWRSHPLLLIKLKWELRVGLGWMDVGTQGVSRLVKGRARARRERSSTEGWRDSTIEVGSAGAERGGGELNR